jgi:hypothetical protein
MSVYELYARKKKYSQAAHNIDKKKMKMSHIITYYTSDHAIGWSFPQPGLRGWSAVAEPQLAGCVMATIAQHGIAKLSLTEPPMRPG